MTVVTWGWTFLGSYVVLMLALGIIGMRRTGDTDSYATARGSYLGAVLGLSYMAMVASGSTFMGSWFPLNENPFASTAIGMMVGFVACLALSRFGRPLPEGHLDRVIAPETAAELEGTAHEQPDTVIA